MQPPRRVIPWRRKNGQQKNIPIAKKSKDMAVFFFQLTLFRGLRGALLRDRSENKCYTIIIPIVTINVKYSYCRRDACYDRERRTTFFFCLRSVPQFWVSFKDRDPDISCTLGERKDGDVVRRPHAGAAYRLHQESHHGSPHRNRNVQSPRHSSKNLEGLESSQGRKPHKGKFP